jgi:hypothetical protein
MALYIAESAHNIGTLANHQRKCHTDTVPKTVKFGIPVPVPVPVNHFNTQVFTSKHLPVPVVNGTNPKKCPSL